MHKRINTILIAMLMAFMLVGCKVTNSKPSLEIKPNDDNTISITADKAGIIDSTLSKGEIQIRFFRDEAPASPDASVEEILHTNEAPALDVTVNDAGTTEHTVDPGSYTIMVNVKKTTTGTIIISVR